MLSLLSTVLLINLIQGQPTELNYTVAIQNSAQTYFSYLPYYHSCNYYFEKNMIPQKIFNTIITAESIYNRIVENDIIVFWEAVKNGFDISLALSQQGTPYQGYILYDSKYSNFNRPIICFNINQSGLTFYSTLVTVEIESLNLTFKQLNSTAVNLTSQASELIQNCTGVNDSNFAYLGGSTFLFVCGELGQGFIFEPFSNTTEPIMKSFQQIGNGTYFLAPNPILMNSKQPLDQLWSCALMFPSDSDHGLFFIYYQDNNITIISEQNARGELLLLIARLWGLQGSSQFIRLIDLYSYLNITAEQYSQYYFPGNITSVLVTEQQNIYVESKLENTTYLCAFNGYGQLYWNVTFDGTVIYFGNQGFIVQAKDYSPSNLTFSYIVTILRPIYMINPQEFNETFDPNTFTKHKLILNCDQSNLTINYNILWTSQYYPTMYIQQLPDNNVYSVDSAHSVQASQKYLMIGPDIRIVPSRPLGLDIYVISSRQVNLSVKTVAVFRADRYVHNISGVLLVTSSQILILTTKGKLYTLINQPCGFDAIVSAEIPQFGQFVLVNSSGQICTCNQNNCFITGINSNEYEQSPQDQIKFNEKQNFSNGTFNSPIKKILYQLVQQYLVIIIYQNNTAILYNFQKKEILLTMQFGCQNQNTTDGIIFTQKFSYNSVLLYCYGAKDIFQFVISETIEYYQRTIPLFGFQTTWKENGIKQTSDYVFLEVTHQSNIYPFMIQNCCILRIDPTQFTVSAIVEIIYANYLIQTLTYENYQFAIMEYISNTAQLTLINIYTSNQWIIFNQTNSTTPLQLFENISMYFQSYFYNLYSFGFTNITFNLTSVQLSTINQTEDISNFNLTLISQDFYYYNLTYNLGDFICGPIFYSQFKVPQGYGSFMKVKQFPPLLPSALIGDGSTSYIQLINPATWRQNITLNNLILCVTSEKMFVYTKSNRGAQMVPTFNFTLPQSLCTYHLYNVSSNNNSVCLISNCFGINNNYETPIINLTYISNRKGPPIVNYSVENIKLPQSLKNIQTVLINNNTNNTTTQSSKSYIIGIVEGPVQLNGKLVICEQLNCTAFNTSNLKALIDYSMYEVNTTLYYIVLVLGKSMVNVYINPTPLADNESEIHPNFSIPFVKYINQPACSTILAISATKSFAQVILSCSLFYYYVNVTYNSSSIQIINKFSRYSQCNLFDEFKPQIFYENEALVMFFTQCRQNQYKQSLNVYVEAQRNNIEGIFTGYLQVFTLTGPLGPNCSKDSISPIQITQISTSMKFPVFITYSITTAPSKIYKFIYEPMNGFLIDNHAKFSPNITLGFKSTETNNTFPQILFLAFNQFYNSSQILTIGNKKTKIDKSPIKEVRAIISFIVFCALNIITIIFGICYPMYLKEQSQKVEGEGEGENIKKIELNFQEQNISDYTPSGRYSITQNRSSYITQSHVSTDSKPFQIEMHFVKSSDARSMKTE